MIKFLLLLLTIRPVISAPYNITLNSTSPIITYTPSRTGPSESTWNVSYTESSWSTWTNQTIGLGTPYHYTRARGAGASISWLGTAIYVYGGLTDTANLIWNLDGDGTSVKSGDELLGYIDGLQRGWHELSLELGDNGGGVNVTGVVMTYDIGGPA